MMSHQLNLPVPLYGLVNIKFASLARMPGRNTCQPSCTSPIHSPPELVCGMQVDLTWHGHDHVYERTCPVFRSECQPANADGSQSAPIHVVIGHAGYELSWFANPTIPDYWDMVVIEHGSWPL